MDESRDQDYNSMLTTTDTDYINIEVPEDTDSLVVPSRAYQLPTLLRPYQWGTPHDRIGAVEFLQQAGRAMCTFQPGLGKTEAAIMACLTPESDYTRTAGPIIIVAPSYLTEMWYDRILEYLPDAPVVLASGTRQAREKILKYKADWYIVNYEMLVSRPARDLNKAPNAPRRTDGTVDLEKLEYLKAFKPKEYKWAVSLPAFDLPRPKKVIFDESHHLKNPNGSQAQAAAELVLPPDIDVIMLSGTPIKRDPDDLYMQMHILYPMETYHRLYHDLAFDGYEKFVRKYCVALPNPYRSGYDIRGARKTQIEHLMDMTAFYTSYEDADVYRPEVEPIPTRFKLDARHQDAYDMVANHYAYQDIKMHSAMEVMHALRACTCAPPKVDNAVAIAKQYDKVVFYTYYINSANLLSEAIGKALGCKIPVIHSDIKDSDREAILDTRPDYLVATVGTLSEGKDLSYMQAVVFFEEVWTPAELEQCTDRVRRFGNEAAKVFVYYLLAKGTIDETIHAVAMARGATAEAIVRKVLDKTRKKLKLTTNPAAAATSDNVIDQRKTGTIVWSNP